MTEDQGMASPFVCGKLIKDPSKFWGRKDELRQIFSHLEKMESISIVGERRIGKSSLAYNVFSTYKQKLNENYQFIWLDGQSNHANSVDSFCLYVSQQGGLGYTSGADHNGCLGNFESAIQRTCQNAGKSIVLIINEFELLTDVSRQHEFNEQFFLTLRLLAEGEKFSLITTSKKPLVDLCAHILPISSPFYNVFIQIPIGEFTNDDIDEFLRSKHDDVTLSDAEISFVKSIPAHHHPLRLQVACHYVFINRQLKFTTEELRGNIIEKTELLMRHSDVEKERTMTRNNHEGKSETRNRIPELIAAILVPILSIALFIGVLTIAIQYLNNIQAVIVSILSSVVGFAVMVFAARFVGIISESTFNRLFGRLINKISLLSKETKSTKK